MIASRNNNLYKLYLIELAECKIRLFDRSVLSNMNGKLAKKKAPITGAFTKRSSFIYYTCKKQVMLRDVVLRICSEKVKVIKYKKQESSPT